MDHKANTLTKEQLKIEIRRFMEDKKRGISLEHFCEVAGINLTDMYKIFIHGKMPLSELYQMRVNKAYRHWKEGKLVVLTTGRGRRYVDYRRNEKPAIVPQMSISLENNRFSLKIGHKNRHDYAERSIFNDK